MMGLRATESGMGASDMRCRQRRGGGAGAWIACLVIKAGFLLLLTGAAGEGQGEDVDQGMRRGWLDEGEGQATASLHRRAGRGLLQDANATGSAGNSTVEASNSTVEASNSTAAGNTPLTSCEVQGEQGENGTNSSSSSSSSPCPAASNSTNVTASAPSALPTGPPLLTSKVMGLWHGTGGFRECGANLASTLDISRSPEGSLLAVLSLISASAHYSDVALDAVAEIVSINMTETLLLTDSSVPGHLVSVYKVRMDLLAVQHWHHGCEGAPVDKTTYWASAASTCALYTNQSSTNCTLGASINVTERSGEFGLTLCLESFWDLPSISLKKGACLKLAQHKAAMPGTYLIEDCTCKNPKDCPPSGASFEVIAVDTQGCIAKMRSGHLTVSGSVLLDCPLNKDKLVLDTVQMGQVVMMASWNEAMWKAPSKMCYGRLRCTHGSCAILKAAADSSGASANACLDRGPEVFFVTPSSAAPGGGTLLTIAGTCLALPAAVTVADYDCSFPALSPAGDLTCMLGPGFGSGLHVAVLREGLASLDACGQEGACALSFDAPSIATVFPTSCPEFGGCLVTVRGSGFGDPTAVAQAVRVVMGGEECSLSCGGCGHVSSEEVRCLALPTTPTAPRPATLTRYAVRPKSLEAGCPKCYGGYLAHDLGGGCACVGVAEGGSFAVLSSSPKIRMVLAGEVAQFDLAEFSRKVAGLAGVGRDSVYVASVEAGSVVVTFAFTNEGVDAAHHIRALANLRISAGNGNLTTSLPNALSLSLLSGVGGGDIALVLAATPPPFDDGGGILVSAWQAVVIVMVVLGGLCGGVVLCVGRKRGWGGDLARHHGHKHKAEDEGEHSRRQSSSFELNQISRAGSGASEHQSITRIV